MITPTHRDALLHVLARALPDKERTIVLGDLQEEGSSLTSSAAEIIGYAVRRELAAWGYVESWLALITITVPLIIMLGSASLSVADGSAISIWCFANNWDLPLLHQAGFWTLLRQSMPSLMWSATALVCWSWCCGALIGATSRTTIKSTAFLITLFFFALWLGWRPLTIDLQPLQLARDVQGNAAVFRVTFYRHMFTPLVQLLLVMAPMYSGLKNAPAQVLRKAWQRRTFWTLLSFSLVSLASRASTWWMTHTWHTSLSPTYRVPSLLPLALCGGLAWLIATRTPTHRLNHLSPETH